jgi:exodeoxyribonuclease VII large subunit
MEPQSNSPEVTYSPSALLNLFNNSISVQQTKKMVLVKGIFVPGKGTNYNGFYYDGLKDEASDAVITLISPALIRNTLTNNKTISFWGYITKRVVNVGGRIELQINLSELLEQTHNKYSEDEIRAIDIARRKVEHGYRDVAGFIKQKIISNEKVRIIILVGRTAIIDQLEEAINAYSINYQRINITSESSIIESLKQYDSQADVLCLSRGGGDNIEVFNKPGIAEACIGLNSLFITAIGHKDDRSLIEQVADKAFITPTALGQFLNDLYNDTVEELQNSKAQLVADITKTLKANYDKQIQNLTEQLQATEKQKQQTITDLKTLSEKEKQVLNQSITAITEQQKGKDDLISNYKRQVDSLQKQASRVPEKETNWVFVVIAIILGILLGLAIGH